MFLCVRETVSLEFEAILVLWLIFNVSIVFLDSGGVLVLMEGLEYLVLFMFILLLPAQIIGVYYIDQQWNQLWRTFPNLTFVDEMI